ncbi:TDP-N-acetylfucosamine:lipid II N-acetylfucosaminyltransferase [Mannheimia haemolytica]
MVGREKRVMLPIYHILGSEIEHHNQQVLTFFQQELLPLLPDSEHFFYVVGKPSLQTAFPHLRIKQFSSQKAIANALIAKKRQNPTACFLLHGQFNPWI